ncbi:ROK family transcriptional regulator [Qingshengfaniella alkalisoli]|uniref:ROK family transcriptional regulator n=1 Tax=Qingshengfaniella alkalisoli TaxID=2599296 RepID=A0A5B8IZP8_9RHOB|nr:ROK family transcriptional regulator [Qingshengfaniella alkalisoli]QDY70421.1 ROK family transcriptional regulator [Qingshengfaniella alkalisoli]
MQPTEVRKLSDGANSTGVRAHNERLTMSTIQRYGQLPGSEISKLTGLSPQTVSNILRKLEGEGFLQRCEPNRGRVGKPSVPMALNPDGALSFGMKIGRRSADLLVMNLKGEVLGQRKTTFKYPMPVEIFSFLQNGIAELSANLSKEQRKRLCGIGIAAPTEIWSWTDVLGAPDDFKIWSRIDLQQELSLISDLPVFLENDATAACRAEHVFGRGREFTDYAYFFIGSFIGGGVVQNSSVTVGAKKNAGAFGSLRVTRLNGDEIALIDAASLYLLDAAIVQDGFDGSVLWRNPQDWSGFATQADHWIKHAAHALAHATRSIGSVLDFEAVLIDGAFPPGIRRQLVECTRSELLKLDLRGMLPPQPEEASIGANARAVGAACAPIYAQYLFP